MERHDHITWTDEKLFDEVTCVAENMRRVKYEGPRLEQMQRRLARAVFEQEQRYREEQGLSIPDYYARVTELA